MCRVPHNGARLVQRRKLDQISLAVPFAALLERKVLKVTVPDGSKGHFPQLVPVAHVGRVGDEPSAPVAATPVDTAGPSWAARVVSHIGPWVGAVPVFHHHSKRVREMAPKRALCHPRVGRVLGQVPFPGVGRDGDVQFVCVDQTGFERGGKVGKPVFDRVRPVEKDCAGVEAIHGIVGNDVGRAADAVHFQRGHNERGPVQRGVDPVQDLVGLLGRVQLEQVPREREGPLGERSTGKDRSVGLAWNGEERVRVRAADKGGPCLGGAKHGGPVRDDRGTGCARCLDRGASQIGAGQRGEREEVVEIAGAWVGTHSCQSRGRLLEGTPPADLVEERGRVLPSDGERAGGGKDGAAGGIAFKPGPLAIEREVERDAVDGEVAGSSAVPVEAAARRPVDQDMDPFPGADRCGRDDVDLSQDVRRQTRPVLFRHGPKGEELAVFRGGHGEERLVEGLRGPAFDGRVDGGVVFGERDGWVDERRSWLERDTRLALAVERERCRRGGGCGGT